MRALALLVLAIAIPASAIADGAGSEEVGLKLVEALNLKAEVERGFKASIAGVTTQLNQMGDATLTKSITELTTKFYDENYKWDKISRVYAIAYAKELTDDEMKAAIAFYETAAGKKLRDKSDAINGEATKVTQELLKSKMLELQRAMIMVVQKRQMEKAGK